MSVLEAGLRLSTGPLPTSPRPLPLTQMKVGAGLESASQVRVTLSRPSLTGDEAELLTVALGGTETETVRGYLAQETGGNSLGSSWDRSFNTSAFSKSTEALSQSHTDKIFSRLPRLFTSEQMRPKMASFALQCTLSTHSESPRPQMPAGTGPAHWWRCRSRSRCQFCIMGNVLQR